MVGVRIKAEEQEGKEEKEGWKGGKGEERREGGRRRGVGEQVRVYMSKSGSNTKCR